MISLSKRSQHFTILGCTYYVPSLHLIFPFKASILFFFVLVFQNRHTSWVLELFVLPFAPLQAFFSLCDFLVPLICVEVVDAYVHVRYLVRVNVIKVKKNSIIKKKFTNAFLSTLYFVFCPMNTKRVKKADNFFLSLITCN